MLSAPEKIGLCGCGCGQPTPIAKRTRGDVRKGEHLRFLHGHSGGRAGRGYEERDCGYSTPCWHWLGTKKQGGYGRLRRDNRRLLAHRVFYEEHVGPIPDGLTLDHLCRNPSCVNPAHLEPVTGTENTRRGDAAKLTPADADAIRRSDEEPSVLATRFGVSRDCIYDVLSGRCWS